MNTEWRVFECSEEDCGYTVVHRVPEGAAPDRACDLDICPGCGALRSIIGYGGAVTVTNQHGRKL